MNTETWKAEAASRRERRVSIPGLTLEKLGAQIGMSASQLQRYERGKAAARADQIERWNAALADAEKEEAAS